MVSYKMFGVTINLGKHTAPRRWGFDLQRMFLHLSLQTLLLTASGSTEELVAAMLLHVEIYLV